MSSFAELTDEFLDAEFRESPVRASALGITSSGGLPISLAERAVLAVA